MTGLFYLYCFIGALFSIHIFLVRPYVWAKWERLDEATQLIKFNAEDYWCKVVISLLFVLLLVVNLDIKFKFLYH